MEISNTELQDLKKKGVLTPNMVNSILKGKEKRGIDIRELRKQLNKIDVRQADFETEEEQAERIDNGLISEDEVKN